MFLIYEGGINVKVYIFDNHIVHYLFSWGGRAVLLRWWHKNISFHLLRIEFQ